MKKVILLLLLFLSVNSFASSKRDQLLNIVNEELREITRLNKQTRSSQPTLLLRMAEVLLEKARILKEGENEKFINLNKKERSNLDRKKFFSGSNKHFIQAQKTCYHILKQFPKFKKRGDVYYILAYNAKEFSDYDTARKFFKLAIKSSSKRSFTRKKSLVALGEFYYNQQEYAKAIPLYEKALKSEGSRWYTKDLFNLAWCYFRVGEKRKAIRSMQKGYRLSKSKKYIDMRYAIERDLAYFYTADGRVKEAIKFYKNVGGNVANNLVKVGRHLINQGKFTPAEGALVEALKYKPKKGLKIDAYFSLLTLYDKYGKTSKHLNVCRELTGHFKRKDLREDDVKDLKYHLQKYSAILQKQVAGNLYKKVKKTRLQKASQAVEYFKLLAILDPGKSEEHYYFAGETYFAIEKFGDALDLYSLARNKAIKDKNKKYIKLSVEGMLACFAHPKSIGKKRVEKFFPIVTNDYIELNPKSKQTSKLLQRLFSFYYDKGIVSKAELQLERYVKLFPKDFKIQEAMLARVMEYYKTKKDKQGIKKWVRVINSGKIRVSKKYAARLKYLLLAMQFENVEKFSTKGEKKSALQGYVEIYKSSESTLDAKKNAAYNISVLFHELGNVDMMHGWLAKAVSMMNSSEIAKFSSSFLVMISDLNNQGQFKKAHGLYNESFEKVCRKNVKAKSTLFQNAITIELIEPEIPIRTTQELIDQFKKCKISLETQRNLLKEYVDYLYDKNNHDELFLIYKKYYRNRSFFPLLSRISSEIGRIKQRLGHDDYQAFLNDAQVFYTKARKEKMKVDYRVFEILAELEVQKLKQRMSNFSNFSFSFPRDVFAKTMTEKFQEVASLKKELDKVYEFGVGDSIVAANKYMVDVYDQLIGKIVSFRPKEFSPENLKLFVKEMESVSQTLVSDKNTIIESTRKLIQKERVLSLKNKFFNLNSESRELLAIPALETVIMDRYGRQR